MKELIPIANVLEESPRVEELEQSGYIIKPEKIDSYLENFKQKSC